MIFQRGDHISVFRIGYWHHGIYEGNGVVIHFTDLRGGKTNAMIRRGPIEKFIGNSTEFKVVPHPDGFDAETTVARAQSRIGQSGYHLWNNNCQHFATWCATGRHESQQVNNVRDVATGFVATLLVGAAGAAYSALTSDNDQDGDYEDEMCLADTLAGDPCPYRAYPGNGGYCRVHRRESA